MSDQEFIPVEPTEPSAQPSEGTVHREPEQRVEQPKAEPKRSLDDVVADAMKKSEEKGKEAKAEKVEKAPKEEEEPAKEDKPKAPRREDGKFAKAEPAEAEESDEPEQPKRETAFREAPKRFDEAARRDWEKVPESVRGSVNRMQREFESGIEKYRADAEEYEQIREYREIAKQGGTTIKAALDNYVGIERMLQQNPIAGLEQIVSNLGLKDNQGQPITFRTLAAHVAGQTPDQVSRQSDIQMQAMRQQLQQSQQQLAEMRQYVQQQQQAERMRATQSEVDAFAAENPRYEELQDYIAETLQKYPGAANMSIKDRLADAYAIAIARHPEAAHTGNPSAQAQTLTPRNRAKSISGSPSAGAQISTNPAKRGKSSIDDAISNAMRRASL